jgi:hypothetical protein
MLVVPLLHGGGGLIVSGKRIYGSTSSCKGMGGEGGGRGVMITERGGEVKA